MSDTDSVPMAGRSDADLPGHWLLARLGKRVLRPGGLELTSRVLDAARLEALQLHAQGLHLRGGYREFVRGLGGLQHCLARKYCEGAAP